MTTPTTVPPAVAALVEAGQAELRQRKEELAAAAGRRDLPLLAAAGARLRAEMGFVPELLGGLYVESLSVAAGRAHLRLAVGGGYPISLYLALGPTGWQVRPGFFVDVHGQAEEVRFHTLAGAVAAAFDQAARVEPAEEDRPARTG